MKGPDLKPFRILKGLTQGDVGDALGRSHTWVAMLERNRAAPTHKQLHALDDLLGFPISQRWTGRIQSRSS